MSPVYETHAGWNANTSACRTLAELPQEARTYLARLQEVSGTPIRLVGVGAARSETIKLAEGGVAA